MVTQEWARFEDELAKEFGLEKVSASGAGPFDKLDLKGNGTRWSLKFTRKERFPISYGDILEGLEKCFGPGGDGTSPFWAARIPLGDFVLMRKEDFSMLQRGEIKLIEQDRPQVAARKQRANTPELLRDGD